MIEASPTSQPTSIVIRNAQVLSLDGDIHRPPRKDVVIAGSIIASIDDPGNAAPVGAGAPEIIDGTGKLLIPGLVNAHYHSADTLCKGLFDPLPFDVWALLAMPAYWGPRSRAELRIRTLLGALESIRTGITTIQDMSGLVPQNEETLDCILDAYRETGIRTVFSIMVRDLPALDIAPFVDADVPEEVRKTIFAAPGNAASDLAFVEAQLNRLADRYGRLSWALSPSGPQRCSAKMLEGISSLSQSFNLPILTHLYETRAQLAKARTEWTEFGGSLINYMDAIGILNRHTTVAHGVYLTEAEIELMARRGAGVIHNPVSNLKLRNGVAPLRSFKESGINLALGCDNNSCSDCQNLFQAMKFYVLLAQAIDGETTGVEAADALRSATTGGARALGLQDQIGEVREGKRADLVLLDLKDYAYQPLNSAARQLVFSETGRAVDTVIIDGQIVFRDGRHLLVNEDLFRQELAELMIEVERDYRQLVERQSSSIQHVTKADKQLRSQTPELSRVIRR